MKIPNREPDVTFPFISESFIRIRAWVNEGIIQRSTEDDTTYSVEKQTTQRLLQLLEDTAISNISMERRRIAADYLVSRALLE